MPSFMLALRTAALACLLISTPSFATALVNKLDPNEAAPSNPPVHSVEWRGVLAEIKSPVADLEARASREAGLLHGPAEVAAEGLVDRIAGSGNYSLQPLQPFIATLGTPAMLSTFTTVQRNKAVSKNGAVVNQAEPIKVGYSIALTPSLLPGTSAGVVMSEVVVVHTRQDGNAVYNANAYHKAGLREGDFQTVVWTTGNKQFLLVLRRKAPPAF